MTTVFAAVVVPGAVVSLRILETNLENGLRLGAEKVLEDYVDSLIGEDPTADPFEQEQGMRIRYFDFGGELSEREYLQRIVGGEAEALVPGEFELAETLENSSPVGVSRSIPVPIELEDNVVAVGQWLLFANGPTVAVGVSSPLAPIEDSMRTITGAATIVVSALLLAVAGMTWATTGWALGPIDRVTRRAQAITADDLSERLPVPSAADGVQALVVTVNDMLGRIERSQQQQRRLISDASHELRSPVAASRAQLEVALSISETSPDAVDWAATAKTVLDEQAQLTELVDGLLALSRLDESGADRSETVDMVALVVSETQRPRQPRPHVTIGPGTEAVVLGDEALLRRSVRNLLDNAVRHADQAVAVGLDVRAGVVGVTIDDDGPGIPEAERERVFERFTRLDESRSRDAGGAGLGLAITRSVVAAHGGHVACETSPLGGARLVLYLPQVGPTRSRM